MKVESMAKIKTRPIYRHQEATLNIPDHGPNFFEPLTEAI